MVEYRFTSRKGGKRFRWKRFPTEPGLPDRFPSRWSGEPALHLTLNTSNKSYEEPQISLIFIFRTENIRRYG